MQYRVKNGPIFGGLEAKPSKNQGKKGDNGIWLDLKVTAGGIARRIWFGKSEVEKVK